VRGLTIALVRTFSLPVVLVVLLPSSSLAGSDDKPCSDAPARLLEAEVETPSSKLLPDEFTGGLHAEVPFAWPRGRNGVEPNLTLRYRSGTGPSWSGLGWNLDPDSIARDTRFGVRYDCGHYTFRAAAQEASLVNTAAFEYRLREEGVFVRFRFLTTPDGNRYWEAQHPNGYRYVYGLSSNARLTGDSPEKTFAWYLERVEDQFGNFMLFKYARQDISEPPFLSEIRYTGFLSQSGAQEDPSVALRFETGNRPDHSVSRTPGFLVRLVRRLTTISVLAKERAIATYEFEYGQSMATGRSLLIRVTKVSAHGERQIILSASYREQGMGWANSATPAWTGGPNPGGPWRDRCVAGDFNGDAREDLICNQSAGKWRHWLSNGAGWEEGHETDGPAFAETAGGSCFPLDANADGKTDLLCHVSATKWSLMRSAAAGWEPPEEVTGPEPGGSARSHCVTGDLDGDSRSDVLCKSASGQWSYGLWRGTTVKLEQTPGPAAPGTLGRSCLPGSYRPDGRLGLLCYQAGPGVHCGDATTGWLDTPASVFHPEICSAMHPMCYQFERAETEAEGWVDWRYKVRHKVHCFRDSTTWQLAVSDGNSLQVSTWSAGPPVRVHLPVAVRCLSADFDGDASSDVVCHAGGSSWYVGTAPATGLSSLEEWTGPLAGEDMPKQCISADFNGDSKEDIACYQQDGTWSTALSSSKGWRSETWSTSGPLSAAADVRSSCLAADFDGDGLPDVACDQGGGSWALSLKQGPTPDLLTAFTNGLGGRTLITYQPSSRWNNAQLPFVMPTVEEIRVESGQAPAALTKLHYQGGYYHLSERDFRGFHVVTKTEQTEGQNDGLVTITKYHQGNDIEVGENHPNVTTGYMKAYPYEVSLRRVNGDPLSETTIRYALMGEVWHFTPAAETNTTTYALDQAHTKQTRRVFEYDRIGNLTRDYDFGDLDDTTDDVLREWSFHPNEQAWLLRFPAEERVWGVRDKRWVPFAQTRYYYDAQGSCQGTIGVPSPVRGALTEVLRVELGGRGDRLDRFRYDRYGNKICDADALARTTLFEYDPSGTFLRSQTNPLSHRHSFYYYGIDFPVSKAGYYGLAHSQLDENRGLTQLFYDAFGRVSLSSGPDGSWQRYTYDNYGDPKNQVLRTDGPLGLWREDYFDGFGRIYRTVSVGPEGRLVEEHTQFDRRGLPLLQSRPRYIGAPGALPSTSNTYDPLGRLIESERWDGARHHNCYEGWATVSVDFLNRGKRIIRDAWARDVQTDRLGNVTPTACPSTAPAPYSSHIVRFDALGQPRQTQLPNGLPVERHFDSLGGLLQTTDPSRGVRTYTRDLVGNVVAEVDGRGATTTTIYDVLDRPVSKNAKLAAASGWLSTKHVYDSLQPNGIGRLAEVTTRTTRRAFRYDALGRILRTDVSVGSARAFVEVLRDPLGRVRELLYSNGRRIWHEYTGTSLTQITSDRGKIATFSDFTATGLPRRVTFGNGVVEQIIYASDEASGCSPPLDHICRSVVLDASGYPLDESTYAYDLQGALREHKSTLLGVATYAYDAFRRLSGFGRDGKVATLQYDQADNVLFTSWIGAHQYGDFGASNKRLRSVLRRAGGFDFKYDGAGNVVEGGGLRLTIDAFGVPARIARSGELQRRAEWAIPLGSRRLDSVTELHFDGLGELTAEVTDGRQTLLGPEGLICKGAACSVTVIAHGRAIAQVDEQETLFLHTDATKSVRFVTASSNRKGVAALLQYLPFGKESAHSGEAAKRVVARFGGRRLSSSAKVYVLGGRVYEPLLGRFLSPDPVDLPSGIDNAYAYARNNPLAFEDPTGGRAQPLFPDEETDHDPSGTSRHEEKGVWDRFKELFAPFVAEYERQEKEREAAERQYEEALAAYNAAQAEGTEEGRSRAWQIFFNDLVFSPVETQRTIEMVVGFGGGITKVVGKLPKAYEFLKTVGVPGKGHQIREVQGGFETAKQLFGELLQPGTQLRMVAGKGTYGPAYIGMGKTGDYVTLREFSSHGGGPTLELNVEGLRKIKFKP
jgi:RHS repeat-associated protein